MSEFVNTPNEKISNKQEKVKILPNEKKYIMVMNENTGEIKGCFPLKNKNLGVGWIALYQEAITQVAKEKLTGEQSSVFLYLLGRVDFDNYLTVNQTQIAEELGIHRVNVTKAIKELRQRDILIEGPRFGLNKTYRLNPYIAHKGTNREKTIADLEEYRAKKKEKNDGN